MSSYNVPHLAGSLHHWKRKQPSENKHSLPADAITHPTGKKIRHCLREAKAYDEGKNSSVRQARTRSVRVTEVQHAPSPPSSRQTQ